MKAVPYIIVQIVHIQGPLKGEIQEFSDPVIEVGRHPSCHIQFPKDLAIVSRKHAQIVREGNRFKLVDKSTNGTFVNGQKIADVFLKNGDVILFAEGGPKVSFLTTVSEKAPAIEPSHVPIPPEPVSPPPQPEMRQDIPAAPQIDPPVAPPITPPSPPVTPPPRAVAPPPTPVPEPSQAAPAPRPQVSPPVDIPVQRVQAPLVVQYGPTLRSFKELPINVGLNPNCELNLDHPSIVDRHAQFFFFNNQYWIKDLSGQHLISIDGNPVEGQAALTQECILSLSPQGPSFKFLEGGRLYEFEEPKPEPSIEEPSPVEEDAEPPAQTPKISKFKSFFRK